MKTIEKGYHIEVVSCENDGDNYRTMAAVFQNVEETKFFKEWFLNHFNPHHDKQKNYGNTCFLKDFSQDEFLQIANELRTKYELPPFESFDNASEKAGRLLRNSEFYYFPVVDKVTTYWCPKTVEFEEI